jgi:hypothetical protein
MSHVAVDETGRALAWPFDYPVGSTRGKFWYLIGNAMPGLV